MSVAIETQPLVDQETDHDLVAVVLPSNVRLKISPDDFWTLCAFNRDLRLERNAEGELIAMSPAGSKSSSANAELTIQLGIWSKADGTGMVFDSSAGFTFPNGAIRSPDASWIKRDRWNALTDAQREVFAPIVPDFVIELLSPSDSRSAARLKMIEYIEQGVRLGWLLDPRSQRAEIYRPGVEAETLFKPQTLSGEEVLPGFILELHPIFQVNTAAPAGGTDG